jgi:hypothetical protein
VARLVHFERFVFAFVMTGVRRRKPFKGAVQ